MISATNISQPMNSIYLKDKNNQIGISNYRIMYQQIKFTKKMQLVIDYNKN